MAQELARLIARYQWLKQQPDEACIATGQGAPCTVAKAREAVFLDIVKYPASDPRISLRQIAFMLEMMADSTADRSLRMLLRDEVLVHVKRMTDRFCSTPVPERARTRSRAAPRQN